MKHRWNYSSCILSVACFFVLLAAAGSITSLQQAATLPGNTGEPQRNDGSTQQPEIGLWVEYVVTEQYDGSVTNTWHWFVTVSFLDATHKNVSLLMLNDDSSGLLASWWIIDTTNTITMDATIWGPMNSFLGQQCVFFADNDSSISTFFSSRAIFSATPVNYQVTSLSPWGPPQDPSVMVSWNIPTSDKRIDYLRNSGLLYKAVHTTGLNTTSLRLARSNLWDMGSQPAFLPIDEARDAWLRWDATVRNTTDGTMAPWATEEIIVSPLSATTYNMSGDFHMRQSNGSVQSMPYEAVTSTVNRISVSMMGPNIDALWVDPDSLYTGGYEDARLAFQVFMQEQNHVLTVECTGTQMLGDHSTYLLESIPGSPVYTMAWVEQATGLVLRTSTFTGGLEYRTELVYGNWFNQSYAIPMPANNSWVEMAGWQEETSNGSSFRLPMTIQSDIVVLNASAIRTISTIRQWDIETNYSDNSILNVTLRTNPWESTTILPMLDQRDLLFESTLMPGWVGKAMMIPVDVRNGTIIHASFGPNPWAAMLIENDNDMVAGKPAIKAITRWQEIQNSTIYVMRGTIWFSKTNGFALEFVSGLDGAPDSMHIKTIKENLTAPLPELNLTVGGFAQYFIINQQDGKSWNQPQELLSEITPSTAGFVNISLSMASIQAYEYENGTTQVQSGITETEWKVDAGKGIVVESPDNNFGSGLDGYFGHLMLGMAPSASVGDWIVMNMGPELDIVFEVMQLGVSKAGHSCFYLQPVTNKTTIERDYGSEEYPYSVDPSSSIEVWMDGSSGILVAIDQAGANSAFNICIGIDYISKPVEPLLQPLDGMRLEYIGWMLNSSLNLGNDTYVPANWSMYAQMYVEGMSNDEYMLGTMFIQAITNTSFDYWNYPDAETFEVLAIEQTVQNKTNRIVAVDNASIYTSSGSWDSNTTFDFQGFYGHPMRLDPGVAIGQYRFINFGPSMELLVVVTGTSMWNGIPTWVVEPAIGIPGAYMEFSQHTGMLVLADIPDRMYMELFRSNALPDGNDLDPAIFNDQPVDGGWAYLGGFSAYSNAYSLPPVSINFITQEMWAKSLDPQRHNITITMWQSTTMNGSQAVMNMSQAITVENSTRLVLDVGGGTYFGTPMTGPVYGFDPGFFYQNGVTVGGLYPIAMGPASFLVGQVTGTATINGKPCWEVHPLDWLYSGMMASAAAYYEMNTGMLMQINWSESESTTFITAINENFTAPLVPQTVNDGFWLSTDGYMLQEGRYSLEDDPSSMLMAMSIFSMIFDNGDGTFSMVTDSNMAMNRSSGISVMDLDTYRVLATNESWAYMSGIIHNGYYGHSMFAIPSARTQIGSFYQLNYGPTMDLPFVVSGTGTHHGRPVWVLTLHPEYLRLIDMNANMSKAIEVWYYQDDGLFAAMFAIDMLTFGTGLYSNHEMAITTLYTSNDASPVPVIDGYWIEYAMEQALNGTVFTEGGFGYESFQTGPATYYARMLMAAGSGSSGMSQTILLEASNMSRYAWNMFMISSSGTSSPPPGLLLTDFMWAPVTLETGDVLYMTLPGSPSGIPMLVTGTLMIGTPAGTRLVNVLEGNGDLFGPGSNVSIVVYYDAASGMLWQFNFSAWQQVGPGAWALMEQTIAAVNTNFLSPTSVIDLDAGFIASYSGFSASYADGMIYTESLSSTIEVLNNSGVQTYLNYTIEFTAGNSWILVESMNNRFTWLDSLQPGSTFQPNTTGAGLWFSSLVVYTDVQVGDKVVMHFGVDVYILTVTSTSTMLFGTIPAILLEGGGGKIQAWYNATDGTLLMIRCKALEKTDMSGHTRTSWFYMARDDLPRSLSASIFYFPTDPESEELILFQDQSTNATARWWAMQDGYMSTIWNPQHTFYGAGSYEVLLVIENSATLALDYATVVVNVTGNYRPTANFHWYGSQKAGANITFVDDSSDVDGFITAWEWLVDGVPAGSGSELNWTWMAAGSFNVTLRVTDNGSLVDEWYNMFYVTVNVLPVADFYVDNEFPYQYQNVNFYGYGSHDDDGSIDTFFWDFGDGTNSTDYWETNHVYNSWGSFLATLTVRDNDGGNGSFSVWVNVQPDWSPYTYFTADDENPLRNQVVGFNASACFDDAGYITSFFWDFGDGDDSTAWFYTSHAYTATGDYLVQLWVTDDRNQTGYHNAWIHVQANQVPYAAFSADKTSVGLDETITFNGSASYDLDDDLSYCTWFWDFGDGLNSSDAWIAYHSYPSPGTYFVTLYIEDTLAANSTFGPIQIDVSSNMAPVASFDYDPVDAWYYTLITFNSTAYDPDGSITAHSWDFENDGTDDATGPVVARYFGIGGNYPVKHTVWDNSNSSNWNIVWVRVWEEPLLFLDVDPLVANEGETVDFDASYSFDRDGWIANWYWDFGDGTNSTASYYESHVYANPGNYTVFLTAWDDLNHSRTINVTIEVLPNAAPVADFWWVPSVPEPWEDVYFYDVSFDTDGTIVQWTFDFGDATGVTFYDFNYQDPTMHQYATTGNYTVTLTVWDEYGKTGMAWASIGVYWPTPPVANFTANATTIYKGDTIAFADNSTDVDGYIASWYWVFGDGQTSTLSYVDVTYLDAGTYNVTLEVWDDDAMWGTTYMNITVLNKLPVALIMPNATPVLSFEDIQFYSISSDPDGWIIAWEWDFDDGGFSSLQNPVHHYISPGLYQVWLTVTDNDGATDNVSTYITVNNRPPAALFWTNLTSTRIGWVVGFWDWSTDDDGSIIAWLWDFGDGSPTSAAQDPAHVFTVAGDYWVNMTVWDDLGANASYAMLISVFDNIPPVADFSATATTVFTGESVTFTDLSVDADGSIVTWSWDFDDGNVSALQNPAHAWSENGVYTVNLTVTDNDGATGSHAIDITVLNRVPLAGFSQNGTEVLTFEDIQFTDLSVDPDGFIVSWLWDFDDSGTSSASDPVHAWADNGIFNVTLVVTDNDGATDVAWVLITVLNQAPAAVFLQNETTVLTFEDIQFTDFSVDPDGTI